MRRQSSPMKTASGSRRSDTSARSRRRTVKAGDARADPKDKAPLLRAYRQAVERIGDGRLEEGTRLLRAILDDDPAMTDVWSQYAATLGRMGRYQEAFEAYAQVIKLQPEEANGALGASSMLLALNRPDEARAHAELALDERAVAGTSGPRPDRRGSQARRRGAAAGRARRRGGPGAADAGLHPRHDCLQQPAVRARRSAFCSRRDRATRGAPRRPRI